MCIRDSNNGVDRRRVYLTGFSNGGMLTYRFACENAHYIAAAAPIAATVAGHCEPSRPVPMVIFHGMKDKRVKYTDGVDNSVRLWSKHNGCDETPISREDDDLRHDVYTNCDAGADVELYAMKRQPHRWPGWKRKTWTGRIDPVSYTHLTLPTTPYV